MLPERMRRRFYTDPSKEDPAARAPGRKERFFDAAVFIVFLLGWSLAFFVSCHLGYLRVYRS